MKKRTTKAISVFLVLLMVFSSVPFSGAGLISFAEDEFNEVNNLLLADGRTGIDNRTDSDFGTNTDIGTDTDNSTDTDIGTETDADIIDSGSCGAQGDNVTYILYDNGLLVISGKGAMADYDYWEEDGEKPPYGNYINDVDNTVKNVIIEYGVTSIGFFAFYRLVTLESATIPDSVTSIGRAAFADCSGLTSITIPDNVTSIGESAFEYCSGLTSVTIPDSVTSIGRVAFADCSGLTSITIPDSVTEIGDGAFADCTRLTSVTIPDSVTSIGRAAFADCSGLTSITIPDNVTSIGYEAFYYCTRLTSVTIPKSVIYIGYNAFGNCINLTHIDVDENNQNYSSVDGVLFNKDKTELIQYPAGNSRTSYEVPDCVNSIGDYAFYKCMSLASITIPNGVTSIGESAFEYCSGLTSVTIPDSVTSIGRAAFADCRGLTSITIPDSVTSIGDYAFLRCFGITSITIPDSVISIGYEAFYYCTSLTSVTIPDSVISIGYEAFYYCTGLTHIDVDENNQYYSSTDGVLLNKDKTELIQYPIGNSRTSYKIPNSVTSIDEFAFRGCSYLMSVTIPDGVTIIDCEVFRKCTGLTSITIPNSVIRIGDMAFSGCYNLTDVYYTGSEEQWHDIIIADGNYYLTDANIHYNYIICDHNNKTSHEAVEATCKEDGYTAGVYCEDCEKWISGHEVIKAHHIDNDGDGICDICQKATSDIIAGETKTIDVAAGETVYLMFVPTASGTYTFKSLSDSDTYGYLYDSYKNELTYNDDDDDGNFSITYDLEAGKTYYWGARYYSSDRSGSFTVSLEAINIKSISFTLAEPIVLTEEIDGDWTYDWVWDEETDDEYRVSWFCYDTPSIYRSGNTITVNYSDDRGSVDYNFDYDEWEFVSKDGDYIDSDDINYSSNQSYNNQWTVGGENYLTVSYFNKNCQVPVEIKENPVESISFTPAEPIVLTEEIDGYWTSDWVWNEATEEDIEVSWFCFNTPSIYRSGNIITVNYNDDRGSVEYYYSDEGAFVSRDGDYIDSDDIGYSSNQSYNNQWTVGGENYLTVSYFNKNCQVPVEIKENPVESISFTPAEPIVLIEGIDGYWTYDWVWDEETDYGDEVYWFRYNTSSTHKEGDVLTINYRDDRGSVDYYFDSDEWGFASEDGDYIDPDAINYSSNQSYNNQWTVGGENYYTISYHGKSCQVPVEIKENPVESISFKLSDSFVLYENSFGNYHTGYWIYDPETDDDQYVKETWFEYSTWELINRIVGNVLTVNYNDGRGTVEYICEFDEEAGFRYVSESGEVIEENEVWAWSDQCDGPSYWWKAGADNYMTVSYFNKNCQAPVEIKENPVEAISYQPSNSIVYELNENGYWVENWAYDEENDEYYEDGEWFSYKKPEINREGDILSVTYNDERGTVDYVCHSSKDSYIYVNEQTGDIYYPCVNVTSDQSYENQFKPGINYFTINTANKDYQLPVILRNGTECAHEELSAPVLDNVIEATCTTDGSYDEVVYCSVCDAELSRETKTIEKLGHDFTEKIVDEAHRKTPATCTEKAVYYYDCSRCAEISRTDTYETGEPLGHDMGAWYTTTAPTCTGKGQEKRDCSRCDYSEVRDIAPTNHAGKYTVERTEPTCTESGFEKGVYCPDCKTWLSGHGVIAKFGHKIVTDKAVAPTCTRSGKTEGKHCSVCGYVLVAQTVVPAKGHSFGEWTVETVASCTEKGTEKRVCANDASHVETRDIDTIAHTEATKEENRVEATCTTDGSYDSVVYCSVCKTELSRETKIIGKLGHSFANYLSDNNATCTADGTKTAKCDRCDTTDTITDVGSAKGHTPAEAVKENEVAATCTTDGSYDSVVYCSVCKTKLSRETKIIGKLDHNWGEWTVETVASCTEKGTEKRVCANDASHVETRDIDTIAHTEATKEENRVEVTCTTDGSYDSVVYCSVCKTELSRETKIIGKLGHSFTNYISDSNASCTADGTKTAKCDRCDTTDTITDVGSAKGHTPAEAVKENEVAATCTTDGSYDSVVYCSVCKTELSRETKIIGKLDHSFTNYISDNNATCTADGTKTAKCDRCDTTDTITDVGSAKGHTPAEAVKENEVAATCTTDGSYDSVVYCSVCKTELSRETKIIEKLGHSFTNYVSNNDATCTADGTKTAKCDRCEVTDTIADAGSAKGHTEKTVNAKKASCKASGYTGDVVCSVCNEVISKGTVIAKLAHKKVVDKAVAATCTKTGLTEGSHCSVCGTVIRKQTTVAKTAHTYKNVITKADATKKKSGKVTPTCSVCGYKKTATTIYYPKTATLSYSSKTYTGKALKPTVTVKDSKGKTISSKYYTVSYKNNTNVGKATITITFKGNYIGKITKTFTIIPKDTSISKLSAKSKGFTATWKKQTIQTTGYEIQYSTSSKFTSKTTKTIKVTSAKTVSKTVSKLKASSKYYVRVRTYKTVSKTNYYSAWSKALSVKTKK